jgi:hypothetical protein
MKSIITLAAAFVFLTHSLGCDAGTPVDPEVSQLYGTWQWLKTQGGFGGDVYTPQSTGQTAKVIFRPTGIAQFYRNDTLVKQLGYAVIKRNPYTGAQDMYCVHYNGSNDYFSDQIISFQGPDTLRLSDVCMDCFNYTYSRVN